MFDMNAVITGNIILTMKEKSIKQIELAEAIDVSKQTMSKMLNGSRTINAIELNSIAKVLKVSIESLVSIPNSIIESNPIRAFMGSVDTKEAKKGLEIADQIADMICFHARTRENGESMMQSWRL